MRLTRLPLGALALFLLIAVPVNAAPALHKGSQTSYDLSVSISFLQSCQPILSSTIQGGIVCPMFTMIPLGLNVNGTLSWAVTDLNATTATLNVTRDITTSSGEIVTPVSPHPGSFIESIDLATRTASFLPFIEPEMDQALQMAQTNMATALPTGTSWSSATSVVDEAMMRQPLHTMWWVNGPLKVNNTIPVLVFPTNVTGSTSVDVGGSIGSRSAWSLEFNKTRALPFPNQLVSLTASIPFADNFEFALTFNYDQTSDLLLSASADIHLGFSEEEFIPPPPCASSMTSPALTVCPDASVPILKELGIDVQASLRLSTTTLDLTQRLTQTSGSDPNGASSFGSGPATGPGPGPGSGSGAGPGSGPNSGPNSGSGGGYNPGSGSTPTGAGQPANSPAQSKPAGQSTGLLPWMYGILGIIVAAIVASGVWIGRRRIKESLS
jgi:hypothetical protein